MDSAKKNFSFTKHNAPGEKRFWFSVDQKAEHTIRCYTHFADVNDCVLVEYKHRDVGFETITHSTINEHMDSVTQGLISFKEECRTMEG